MAGDRRFQWAHVVVALSLLLLLASACRAQDERLEEHTEPPCTVDVAGAFAYPKGEDGRNFNMGWGVQVGGGLAVWRSPRGRGFSVYITADFMYEKFSATPAALALAKTANPTELANATSAHGGFPAVTLGPTVRYAFSRRLSIYGTTGIGWLRRGIGFQGANPATLLQSSGASLDRLASNSGVFDFGGGFNYRPPKLGGLAVFVEVRRYGGLAINHGTTLVPVSVGIRW